MKKLLSLALYCIMLTLGTAQKSMAQQHTSLLEGLTFEAPTKMIRCKGNSANVRQNPAPKAKVVTSLIKEYLFPVLDENAGWYKTMCYSDIGWVSKTVVREEEPTPITSNMYDRMFGESEAYDSWDMWRVSRPVGKYGLTLMYNEYGGILRLGKQVGNVFVFKYELYLSVYDNSKDAPKADLFEIDKIDRGEVTQYQLSVGSKYMKEYKIGESGSAPYLNLSAFTDEMIETLFGDAIRNNDVHVSYITADWFSEKYAHFILG